jgi:hypothetical protein
MTTTTAASLTACFTANCDGRQPETNPLAVDPIPADTALYDAMPGQPLNPTDFADTVTATAYVFQERSGGRWIHPNHDEPGNYTDKETRGILGRYRRATFGMPARFSQDSDGTIYASIKMNGARFIPAALVPGYDLDECAGCHTPYASNGDGPCPITYPNSPAVTAPAATPLDWALRTVDGDTISCDTRETAEEMASGRPHLTVVHRTPGADWQITALTEATDPVAAYAELLAGAIETVFGTPAAVLDGEPHRIGATLPDGTPISLNLSRTRTPADMGALTAAARETLMDREDTGKAVTTVSVDTVHDDSGWISYADTATLTHHDGTTQQLNIKDTALSRALELHADDEAELGIIPTVTIPVPLPTVPANNRVRCDEHPGVHVETVACRHPHNDHPDADEPNFEGNPYRPTD